MTLHARLEEILRTDPITLRALEEARTFDLPNWWLVSGAIYNTVWNVLTGRPSGHGIKDIDLMYFDADTTWEAEDRVIRRGAAHFSADPPIEIRNQARVHLWYEDHFGHPIAPLISTEDSILNFASKTHAVGVRLEPDDTLTVCAPFGLEAIFGMRMEPNLRNPNRGTHEEKAARCKTLWPELKIAPWPNGPRIARAPADTDWAALLCLLHRAFAYMDGRIDPPSSLHKLTAEGLANKARIETCLVAITGDRILGCAFCQLHRDHLYLGKLAVDPVHQGNGIGRLLMNEAKAEARAFAKPAILLETRIELLENHAAFERMGFAKTGETCHPGYPRPTSITMRCNL